jgi:predicted phage replisome organizer
MKLIDSMAENETIHYIWHRLLIQAGKINDNGYIYLSQDEAYTEEMLSIIFSRTIEGIKIALNTLKKFGMIQINEKNFIKITNWEKHQNVEGMERAREQSRKRMQKYRDKKKSELYEEDDQLILEENITSAESDVTVTIQKENKNKSKKENKIKKENKNQDLELESGTSVDVIEETKNEKLKAENLEKQAIKVLSFYEKVTGKAGIFSPNALLVAIDSHGESYVKMAIDKALEVDKPNINYINGILRNWKKTGYPKGEIDHGKCCLTDSGEFKDFKPKKAKELSDEERKLAESRLI